MSGAVGIAGRCGGRRYNERRACVAALQADAAGGAHAIEGKHSAGMRAAPVSEATSIYAKLAFGRAISAVVRRCTFWHFRSWKSALFRTVGLGFNQRGSGRVDSAGRSSSSGELFSYRLSSAADMAPMQAEAWRLQVCGSATSGVRQL